MRRHEPEEPLQSRSRSHSCDNRRRTSVGSAGTSGARPISGSFSADNGPPARPPARSIGGSFSADGIQPPKASTHIQIKRPERDSDSLDRRTRPTSRSTNERVASLSVGTPTSPSGSPGTMFLNPGSPGQANYKCQKFNRSASPSLPPEMSPDISWKALFQRQYSPELKIFSEFVGKKDPDGLFCTPFWDKLLFGSFDQ